MTAMYMAARTNKIRIGSYIALGALYDPRRLAEEAAMVDVFSKGRLWFGLGLGYQQMDFDIYDIPMKRRVSMYEEVVQIVRSALRGERVNFTGKRFRVKDFDLRPKPLQSPPPPVYLGA